LHHKRRRAGRMIVRDGHRFGQPGLAGYVRQVQLQPVLQLIANRPRRRLPRARSSGDL
jgi:hypothetical protein